MSLERIFVKDLRETERKRDCAHLCVSVCVCVEGGGEARGGALSHTP